MTYYDEYKAFIASIDDTQAVTNCHGTLSENIDYLATWDSSHFLNDHQNLYWESALSAAKRVYKAWPIYYPELIPVVEEIEPSGC